MPNFSLLQSAFQNNRPVPVPVNNQAAALQSDFEKSKLAAALQLQQHNVTVGSGGGGGGPNIDGFGSFAERDAAQKKQRAELSLVQAQARLASAAAKGKTQEYGKALNQVSQQQSKAYTRYIQNLATGYAKNPAVKSVLGGK